jgi:hypothetical protein
MKGVAMPATVEEKFQYFDFIAGVGLLWRVDQFVILARNGFGKDLGRDQNK